MFPVLTCTTHDPNGQFVPLLEQWFPFLSERFQKIVISSSPGLHQATRGFLRHHGVEVHELNENLIGLNYKTAIVEGSKYGDIFYVDLDRALHWVASYPDELDRLLHEIGAKKWVIGERGERAMETHQKPLRETEPVFTLALDSFTGWGNHDYLSGAFSLAKPLAEILALKLTRPDQSWWGQYYMILHKAGYKPEFVSCEGLEWETPDRFGKEIAALGFDAWRAQFETAKEWSLRLAWLKQYIEGALAEG